MIDIEALHFLRLSWSTTIKVSIPQRRRSRAPAGEPLATGPRGRRDGRGRERLKVPRR
jgi:hypothetical protein